MFKWNPFSMYSNHPGEVRFIGVGSSKSKSRPVQVPLLTPEQQGLLSTMIGEAGTAIKEGVPSYPKEMYVPRTPEEGRYFSSVYDNEANRVAALNQILSGKPAYEITPETTERLYEEGIRAPALREWEEITKPTITEQFVGPGYWGSARAEAVTKGAQDLATTLAAERAKLYYADEQAKRAALEAGVTRQAQFGPGAAATEAATMGSAGQYARMIEQEKVTSDFQRWLMGEQVEGEDVGAYNPYIQVALNLLGIEAFDVGQRTQSSGWNFEITY